MTRLKALWILFVLARMFALGIYADRESRTITIHCTGVSI